MLWIVGAVLQLFVVWGYFAVAPDRTPSFETWGVTLRIIEFPLLVALLYLAVGPATSRSATVQLLRKGPQR